MPFSFEGKPVRTVIRNGDPWFVLADVCRVLEHSNPSMAAKGLDDDEKYALGQNEGAEINGLGGVGNSTVNVISELSGPMWRPCWATLTPIRRSGRTARQ